MVFGLRAIFWSVYLLIFLNGAATNPRNSQEGGGLVEIPVDSPARHYGSTVDYSSLELAETTGIYLMESSLNHRAYAIFRLAEIINSLAMPYIFIGTIGWANLKDSEGVMVWFILSIFIASAFDLLTVTSGYVREKKWARGSLELFDPSMEDDFDLLSYGGYTIFKLFLTSMMGVIFWFSAFAMYLVTVNPMIVTVFAFLLMFARFRIDTNLCPLRS